MLRSAEAALDAQDYERAIELIVDAGPELRTDPKAEFRALLDEAWGRMSMGEVEAAVAKLERARFISDGELFSDVERADVFFRLGCCRLKLGAVANSAQLLTLALELCDRSGYSCQRLRAGILIWRTRCYRRQRDWDGARADAEAAAHDARHALELLDGRDDHINEIGSAQLVLGQALTDQGQFSAAADALSAAEESFTRMGSLGHRAAAWLAQGDLSRREGDLE